MLRALPLALLVVSSGCASSRARLVNASGDTTTLRGDTTCGQVRLRRTALGSRWGEYLRVRATTFSTIVGTARLHLGGRVLKERAFIVSGDDLVLEQRWTNETLSVASALPKGAALELTVDGLTPAQGTCADLAFTVEQGAVVPDVDEAEWLAQLQRREGVSTPAAAAKATARGPVAPAPAAARKASPAKRPAKPTSAASEWAAWAGHDADVDTSEWAPWPLASRFTAPTVGPPLARGAWLAYSAHPEARRPADALAQHYRLATLDRPEHLAALVERLRRDAPSDDAAALALFAGLPATKQALAAAGEGASVEALARHLPARERPALAPAQLALMLATAFGLSWPVPDLTHVSSPFGPRLHPTLGGERLHTGVDLSVPEGTPIVATGDGVVVRAGQTKVNGRFVVVDHGRGVTTAYLHNARVFVEEGQRVRAGDFIALSGNTGRSTGPHLHYQLELERQPVDPLYFRAPAPALTAAR